MTGPELLIASARVPNDEGGISRHPAFIDNCPTISHTCYLIALST